MWASAHQPTSEQLAEISNFVEERELEPTVYYLKDLNPEMYLEMINSSDSEDDVQELAYRFTKFVDGEYKIVYQPAGSLLFHFCLGALAEYSDTIIAYSYSKRVSEDIPHPDGSVKKVSVFKHEKFMYI